MIGVNDAPGKPLVTVIPSSLEITPKIVSVTPTRLVPGLSRLRILALHTVQTLTTDTHVNVLGNSDSSHRGNIGRRLLAVCSVFCSLALVFREKVLQRKN